MNPLKEMRWLIRIYNSKATYDRWMFKLKTNAVPMKKSDFERIVQAPPRSMEFSEWFDSLIDLGIISNAGKVEINGSITLVDVWVANGREIFKYVQKTPQLKEIYDEDNKFYEREKLL